MLQARRNSWLGSISLAQPIPLWVLTGAASAAALIIVLFLIFGTYTRRATVSGHLVPSMGLAAVPAPATGLVSRLEVAEGDHVKAGQTLAVIRVPSTTLGSGDTFTALEQELQRRQDGLESVNDAQHQLHAIQAGGLKAQLDSTRRELAQINAEIATRQQQMRISTETLARMRTLAQKGFVSQLQLQQQDNAVLEQRAGVQTLQRQATGIERALVQLEQSLREMPSQQQLSDAGFKQDLARLEQDRVETQARGGLVVRAPVDGVIATPLIKPGQAVQAGQTLLSVLPGQGELEAELLIPSRAIGFIEPGDRVLLRYQAYPYQRFGHHPGTVARISRSALEGGGGGGSATAAADQTDAMYRVTVSLSEQSVLAYGKAEPLKPGMLLDADILGEKRRLIEWIYEPLQTLRGNVNG